MRSGQERFTWMTRVYYKEAQGCIIMFDLTSRNSFENAIKWKKDVDSKCSLEDGAPVPCMLLANKVSTLSLINDSIVKSLAFIVTRNILSVMIQRDV